METIFLILAIVWSILCLILFFKIWGMTSDVAEIKELLRNRPLQINTPEPQNKPQNKKASTAPKSSPISDEKKIKAMHHC